MICANESKTLKQFSIGMMICLVALALLVLAPSRMTAQQNPTIAGDYAGTLGPLHIKLHLKASPSGKVTGTLDSPERGAFGIRCDNFRVEGQTVTFTVPALQGTWKGTVAADGKLTGTWDQGHTLSLNFARDSALQTENASLN